MILKKSEVEGSNKDVALSITTILGYFKEILIGVNDGLNLILMCIL